MTLSRRRGDTESRLSGQKPPVKTRGRRLGLRLRWADKGGKPDGARLAKHTLVGRVRRCPFRKLLDVTSSFPPALYEEESVFSEIKDIQQLPVKEVCASRLRPCIIISFKKWLLGPGRWLSG